MIYEVVVEMCSRHNIQMDDNLRRRICLLGIIRSESPDWLQKEATATLDLVIEELLKQGDLTHNTSSRVGKLLANYVAHLGRIGINLSLPSYLPENNNK